MKILLVEDDKFIAQTLENILRERHYIVDRAGEGQLGWEFVETYNYDLIVLDIILPQLNGIEFCKRLRATGNQTPVLLLTAQNSSNKKVIGLDAGADDYVVKPFEISELLARIRVLLRRRNSLESPILSRGKLRLNSSTHKVTYDEQNLNLTPKEYRFLELFLRNGDRVLTRELILERLWDVEEAPSENTIAAHIKDLRRKLKQAGASADWIETVYGVGYRLKPLSDSAEDREEEISTCSQPKKKDESETEQLLRQQTKTALTKVWHKFEDSHNQRLEILELANRAWQENTLEGELLQQAQLAAHRLAGGLGVFGFSYGSRLALEMEELLTIESKQDRAKQFSELLSGLKKALEGNFKPKTQNLARNSSILKKISVSCVARHRPVVIAVDNHPQLAGQIMAEMTAVGMSAKLVSNSQAIALALEQDSLDAVVWNFSLAECTAKTLEKFAGIIGGQLPLPVILFTDSESQSERLKISRLDYPVFLQPIVSGSSSSKAVLRIVNTLEQARHRVAKILLVDDDRQILEAVNSLLNPLNIDLTVLDNPQNFWQIITQLEPDLLILDVAMPYFTGIELCQLTRNDPRWRDLPILFLTVHSDRHTIEQILSAGANDRIGKTQTYSELVPKIFNHLDRRQLLPSLATSQ